LLLNAGGLELATDQDLEINHELRIAGLANMAAGLAGGLVGYKQLSLSTLNFNLGARNRLPGLIGVAVCVIVLLAGNSMLAYFPRLVIGALLFYLGFGFLSEWVIEGFFKLPKIDYAIVLVILLVTITAGFLEAVGLGLVLAVVMFVVSYSQVDVVRHELDGASYQSRVSRSHQQQQALQEAGSKLYILQLQGFVFFGTANNLLNQVRQRLGDPQRPPPDYVVFDFQRVAGLDSTGMLSFSRLAQLAQNEGFALVLTAPNERVGRQLQRGNLVDDGRFVRVFPSLDQGIEWCEERLLAAAGLAMQLQAILPEAADLADLIAYFARFEVAGGEVIIHMGDVPDDMYFVETGEVTSQIVREGKAPLRLETIGSGSSLGEIGFYLRHPRTAEVVADRASVLYRLSLADLQRLEEEAPHLAAELHKLIVHLLAVRVINLTNIVRALER
jgi:SulP family sulfate permease